MVEDAGAEKGAVGEGDVVRSWSIGLIRVEVGWLGCETCSYPEM